MSGPEQAKERKDLELLPKADQMPKWRAWAARSDTPLLQQGRRCQQPASGRRTPRGRTPDSAPRGLAPTNTACAEGLRRRSSNTARPAADSAKPALLKALAESDTSDKPQLCWALAMVKASEAFDTVMSEYRQGHLAEIQKIDGSPAFDPEVLSGMVTLDKLAAMAGDESESVRQLVATDLSRTGIHGSIR